ncbi:hypothetical protein RchiOBHm_Chr2g0158261 [Rosa chinensis]|uniref:Uncharacterized protein n=1 Tax=Rosa chinensis TaxID=74649 RepID=A0A2P6S216_ROSCH|nr:hypothetical protein RchiOBHm_Chr2g0158261 [Rosa chinensis]
MTLLDTFFSSRSNFSYIMGSRILRNRWETVIFFLLQACKWCCCCCCCFVILTVIFHLSFLIFILEVK